MPTSTRYVVRPKVVYETFDDEVIIINLENGNYFSVAGSGAAIWRTATTFRSRGAERR